MTIDKQKIINMALTEIGAGPMFSIDDDSDLAAQITLVWERTCDAVFGMHDWTFARTTSQLRRLAEAPNNGWCHAFELPSPRIGNPLAYRRGPRYVDGIIRDFTLQKGNVYCNESVLWAVYKQLVDPDYWDPPFRSGFIVALAGNLAVPVWQDEDMRDRLLARAFGTASMQGTGGEIGRLMAQDKASAPIGEEPLLSNDPLTGVRMTSGSADNWYGRW